MVPVYVLTVEDGDTVRWVSVPIILNAIAAMEGALFVAVRG